MFKLFTGLHGLKWAASRGFQPSKKLLTVKPSTIFASSLLIASYWSFNNFKFITADSLFFKQDTIDIDNAVSPFPTSVKSPDDSKLEYSLLGHGIRKVTFLGFKVYALGIYIANEDVAKIPKVLNSHYLSQVFVDKHDPAKSHQENLQLALNDSKTSDILVNNLLDSNIRFLVRIAPVRDTDFNHLRDGFVKSCIRNNYVKTQNAEKLNEGIDEIRQIFKLHRSKCPKNHVFIVETDQIGHTSFYYEDYGKQPEKRVVENQLYLGTVNETVISKALLLNYFTNNNPISKGARDICIDEIVRLV